MDARTKCGDSMLNSSRISRLFAGRTVLRACVKYLIAFWSRQEAASEVISSRFTWQIVPNKCITLSDPRLNRSGEIRRKAVGAGIFEFFSE